ncbi:type VI secretion system lipoprotein TssJ [Paraburkholderia phenazinium]|jgi:type VI secretion system protein VasD|uniref:Type VI secretion system protein VasD n=1 Tax=Paraburkholderia phenazinium TaxID=60549 RepID=A0A1G8G1Q3_9BURK|nr:type VI secretion system lipoprotein TssJ [Paraburkholderia phenazinium]SDH88319.1 type VI secretion system protein VasD [Paraburkholderia phenazinium]
MNLRFIRYASLLAACTILAGCAAALPVLGSAASAALQATGLSKPDVPDAQKPPRNIGLTLYAAQNLNAATDQKPLALVVRLYVLKDPTSFQQAPFDAFTDPDKEKSTLGGDLLGVREVTLIPGQRYTVTEKVSREAQAFGIVALFRDPAMQRWKFAFDPAKSEKSGIMIGLHNCAMTVTNGTVIPPEQGLPAQSLNMLSSVSCG